MVEKIYFRVSGRVQGVCFRAYTVSAADECKVSGWVRNRIEGDVEGEAFGDDAALEKFVKWLYTGSPGSSVDQVHIERAGPVENPPDVFSIRF